MSNESGRRIASVGNALRVLRTLAANPEGVGVTQLAQLIGVGKSSAHLLLTTLAVTKRRRSWIPRTRPPLSTTPTPTVPARVFR